MTIEAIDSLRRVRDLLAELDADRDDADAGLAVQAFDAFLDPFADGLTLGQAFEVEPTLGHESWRKGARRVLRDEAIRALAQLYPGSVLHKAGEVRSAIARYRAGRWTRVDRFKEDMPPEYVGSTSEFLFAAFHANVGMPASVGSFWRIIAASHEQPTFHGEQSRRPCQADQKRLTMALAARTLDDDNVISILRGSTVVKAALDEQVAAVTRQRKSQISALRKLEETAAVEIPKLAAAVDAAFAGVREAEAQLAAAQRRAAAAMATKSNASFSFDREHGEVEAALRASAALVVGPFVAAMREMSYRSRREPPVYRTAVAAVASPKTGRKESYLTSNARAVATRLQSIRDTIAVAEDLALALAEPSEIEAALAELRRKIPA
jgi:hypothetical protein